MESSQLKLPTQEIEAPVANKEFLATKLSYINDVMHRLQEYVSQVCSLPGIRGREDMQDVVWFVLRDFVAFFWDLPASAGHHHSDRWGLLRHSLEVGYKRAEAASSEIAVDKEGNPSAEAAHKQRAEKVLVSWIAGLFHDCGKISDIDLRYRNGNREIIYSPFSGNVLDYKLKHPDPGIQLKWLTGRGMRHSSRNHAVFCLAFQREILKQLPRDLVETLFDKLVEDGDVADQESVAQDRQATDREYVQEAVKLFARDGFMAKDNKGRKQRRVFHLGEGIYAVITPLVFQALAQYVKDEIKEKKYSQDHVVHYLQNNGLLYVSKSEEGGGHYFLKLQGYINDNEVSFHVAFVSGDVFADVDTSRLSTLKIKYDEESRAKIKDILGYDPPSSWFVGHPGNIAEEDPAGHTQTPQDPEDPLADMEGEQVTANAATVQAMSNLYALLESGQATINDREDETNLGFISANDQYLWLYLSKSKLRPVLQTEGFAETLNDALEELHKNDVLVPFSDGSYQQRVYTRFYDHDGQLASTPKNPFIRLDTEAIERCVPEMKAYFRREATDDVS